MATAFKTSPSKNGKSGSGKSGSKSQKTDSVRAVKSDDAIDVAPIDASRNTVLEPKPTISNSKVTAEMAKKTKPTKNEKKAPELTPVDMMMDENEHLKTAVQQIEAQFG